LAAVAVADSGEQLQCIASVEPAAVDTDQQAVIDTGASEDMCLSAAVPYDNSSSTAEAAAISFSSTAGSSSSRDAVLTAMIAYDESRLLQCEQADVDACDATVSAAPHAAPLAATIAVAASTVVATPAVAAVPAAPIAVIAAAADVSAVAIGVSGAGADSGNSNRQQHWQQQTLYMQTARLQS
jgi:hypothetical protein